MNWSDLLGIAGGFVAGFLSGTIGIGGGLLFVPTMTVDLRQGNVLREPALLMGGGGVVGAVIGALVAVEVPGPILARVWGAFLVFSAFRLFTQGFQTAPQQP